MGGAGESGGGKIKMSVLEQQQQKSIFGMLLLRHISAFERVGTCIT